MILDAIIHGISIILWYLGSLLCRLLDLIYDMFRIFSGQDQVIYVTSKGEQPSYLLNVFFSNSTITKIYWGLALLAIVMCGVFTAWAVIKKTFDSNEKVKNSIGGILTSACKAILIMLLMTGIVTVTVSATNILMQQITWVFDNADNLNQAQDYTFTDEDYGTMFRILNTIGNYSMNLNYNSRYNINSCYNDIRGDMQDLDSRGIFDFDYQYYITRYANGSYEMESNGAEKKKMQMESWQKVLKQIYDAGNIYEEVNCDDYYPSIQTAILSCMDEMKNNASFGPLPNRYYERVNANLSNDMKPGVIVMLASSIGSENQTVDPAGLMDSSRIAYYTYTKDVYDLGEVDNDFNIDIGHGWNYLVMYLGAYLLIKEFAACLLNCVARIFNMILLYLIAPFALSTMPLDDGGKFKQWSTAFIVQTFSVFGTVIAIRVLMMFVPLILSSNLILFDNIIMNILAKIILILGGAMTASKAASLITGILADNAGMAAIQAGDIGNAARGAVSSAAKGVGAAAAIGAKAGGGALKGAATVLGLTTAANAVSNKVGGAVGAAGKAMKEHGGIFGAIAHAKKEGKSAAGKKEAAGNKDKGGGDKGGGDKGKGDGDKGKGDNKENKGPGILSQAANLGAGMVKDGLQAIDNATGGPGNPPPGGGPEPKKEPPIPDKSKTDVKKDGK